MAIFDGKLGLHFVTHIATGYTVPEWIELAELAHRRGFEQVWINDNVGYRPPLVVLTAMAARVPIRLGTAVLVPYFHHPLDLADSLAALSELCGGRDIDVGLARGSLGLTPREVEVVRPLAMIREMTQFLRPVLRGEEVRYRDFPLLQDYFRLNPDGQFHVSFKPSSRFWFYGGGIGPKALEITGRFLDGLISSGTFISMVRAGRQASLLAIADEAARQVDPHKKVHKVCELNLSLSTDRKQAFEFPKRQVAQAALQWEAFRFTEAEYAALGVERERVLKLQHHFNSGGSMKDAAAFVSEDMVRACYVVGRPEEVLEQIVDLCRLASGMGYHQIAFSKLGPDYREAINLLADRVLPALR